MPPLGSEELVLLDNAVQRVKEHGDWIRKIFVTLVDDDQFVNSIWRSLHFCAQHLKTKAQSKCIRWFHKVFCVRFKWPIDELVPVHKFEAPVELSIHNFELVRLAFVVLHYHANHLIRCWVIIPLHAKTWNQIVVLV